MTWGFYLFNWVYNICQLIMITTKEVNKRSRNCIFPNSYLYSNMKPLYWYVAVREISNIVYWTYLKLPYTTVFLGAFLHKQICQSKGKKMKYILWMEKDYLCLGEASKWNHSFMSECLILWKLDRLAAVLLSWTSLLL